jgi:UDP-galactopyranose mutase
VAVIGAGWSGAAAARELHDHGARVEVFEALGVVGGHARAERDNGVVYEPQGPHIFHTSDSRANAFVNRFGLSRPFCFQPLTRIDVDGEPRHLSWPLQVADLATLPWWERIRRELAARPPRPSMENFESYCISTLGETVYRLFIYHYTRKHWGLEPRLLSAEMAARRVHLRTNGDRRLFQDRWEYLHPEGANAVIEAALAGIPVHLHSEVGIGDLESALRQSFDHVVCTAPLDRFLGQEEELPWRGIEVKARYVETDTLDGTVTRAYMINQPDPGVPFTRTVETKHATGQRIRGTVVCEEYPGSPARHYPVPTFDSRHERQNERLKRLIAQHSPIPVSFCGRLANYQYINQDEAILQGLRVADELLRNG